MKIIRRIPLVHELLRQYNKMYVAKFTGDIVTICTQRIHSETPLTTYKYASSFASFQRDAAYCAHLYVIPKVHSVGIVV